MGKYTYTGLCSKCAKTAEALDTNQGTVCVECFHEAIRKGKETIYSSTLLEDRKVYVLSWSETALEILTEEGLFYAFLRKEDAEEFLAGFRKRTKDGLPGVVVKEAEAKVLINYVLGQPGLRMVGVERIVEEAAEGRKENP